jgi:phosphoesterase RecJ-like protein
MSVAVPAALLDFIYNGNKFLIGGHQEPDGDCAGSQLALCSALRRLGKQAIPLSAGPFKRTEILPWKDRFKAAPDEADRKDARVIIVDCSTLERTGNLEAHLRGLPLAAIDHHRTATPSGQVFFIDALAPATTTLIFSLMEALGLAPTREEAEYLFFGQATDTGFFRHLDEHGADTFTLAASLLRAGANPKKAYNEIFGGKSLDSRKLLGLVLTRARAYFDGRLILSTESYEDTQRYGAEGRDSDSLYQLLQSVRGVEAVVIIRQESPEYCSIGFRSRDRVDVSKAAVVFGGGGHKNAAGARVKGVIAGLEGPVLETFAGLFTHLTSFA